LSLVLRFGELDRDDRGETFTNVVTGEVLVPFPEKPLVPSVQVDKRGECRTEPFLVGSTLCRVDGVGEGVHRGGKRLVPLHGDLDRYAVALFLEGDDRRVRRLLLGVDVFDVVGQAPLVVVGVDGRTTVGVFGTLVADGDGQPLVEEG